ncbi:hydroxyacid dehydrogenase [Thermoclostridium stercorarium subsp. leptospartum DSM 9219]|uniref:Hydroxyacid dehydrogenase n=1 Tax=Thermoclostridium stercorarium subsp. leptospartum DSM 9219 TaxID=1346611 RepID=A0A1B1YLF9_THEST|nr:D-2-hydroxyacid dehydrogenase [Thermoclostridium stercorarium]ANX01576.1 hydroxyacid dehydrogenase [Thermoclostridium stercorarium subsp. leptospartum DSM 9219]
MTETDRKILVLYNIAFTPDKGFIERLIHGYGFRCDVKHTREAVQEDYLDAEVIIGQPNPKYLKKAKKLKWVQLTSAGADHVADASLYANNDIILTNASGVYGKPIAEHVFAMILAFNRNLMQYERNRQNGKWSPVLPMRDFYGSTLCVIGFGDIGKEVAIRGKALGARVIAVKRTVGECPPYVDELYLTDEIDKVLPKADYLVLALPNTPETRGILSEERIKKLKPEVFIVNVGRGTAICQEALIRALQEGRIAGAGLDVTDPEPLPADSPLWKMPNVIITSHTSGFSPQNWNRHAELIRENLSRYVEGRPLLNRVDFNKKY